VLFLMLTAHQLLKSDIPLTHLSQLEIAQARLSNC
jgi:hypothetical protein